MSNIELIVESDLSPKDEEILRSIANIKYKIPLINSFVIDIPEENIEKLKSLKCLKTVFQNTHITMQMDTARKTVNADIIQDKGYTGKGIGIAILDTGISPINDFLYPKNRIVAFKDFISNKTYPYDDNGHGTHVAGIAGGNGISSNGKYKGIAPSCNLIGIKVLDKDGKGNASSVLAGLQWIINNKEKYNIKIGKYKGIAPSCNLIGIKVLDKDGKGNASSVLAGLQWIINNKEKYNIKIANLSIGTDNKSSNDPLVKAVEKIWDSGIIVTIAAGNDGPKKYSISSPAISKKVITIGASDDNITANVWGNNLINFSGRGPTLDCVIKPDVLAPGVNIISCLSNNVSIKNNEIVDKNYLSLSGTSMSTPIVSGAIALLLEKHKNLKPNDVKLMLKKCCKNLHLPKNQQGWGLINVYNLLSQEVCYATK